MLRTTLKPLGDLTALERRWRALEADADVRFFRGWTFLGCLAEERFAHARLLAVSQDGCDVALALLGHGRGQHWLNQTGAPEHDAVFIEHNGLLVRSGHGDALATALHQVTGPLVLSGIDDATLAEARQAGWLIPDESRLAPFVRLDLLEGPYLRTLSANARAQIGRSMRLYGPSLELSRAESTDQALSWLDELFALHQAAWARRGQPGAFADPAMRRFHRVLVARAWPCGEADLLRVRAGPRVVGLLYNFIQGGRVMNYQSGFDTDPSRPREKPGLVSHALAIQHYADRGATIYDLLAGAQRYKLTLARDGAMLHWATLYRPWSISGLAARARQRAGSVRAALRPEPQTPGRAG